MKYQARESVQIEQSNKNGYVMDGQQLDTEQSDKDEKGKHDGQIRSSQNGRYFRHG